MPCHKKKGKKGRHPRINLLFLFCSSQTYRAAQYTYHDCVSGSVSAGSAVHTSPSASTV